uniref:Protein EARLY FLOWERING 4 domain-containing protein n=1 Tax=Opuntia streptacantha TaxID=393608 RepID=A0A7C8ZRV3_OPUST
MEDSTNDLRKTLAKDSHSLTLKRAADRRSDGRFRRREIACDDADEECDAEAWETLSSGIERVQSVLDQNRALIQQVNDNHQSKIPDNLVKNVALIREINGNINKVLSIYSDLSVNFTDLVRQRKAVSKNINGNVGAKSGSDIMDAAAVQ